MLERIVRWLLFWFPTSLQPFPASSPWKAQSHGLLESKPTAQSGLTDGRTPKRREPPQRAKRCPQGLKNWGAGSGSPRFISVFFCFWSEDAKHSSNSWLIWTFSVPKLITPFTEGLGLPASFAPPPPPAPRHSLFF